MGPWRRPAFFLLVSWILVLGSVGLWGRHYVELFLPLQRWAIGRCLPDAWRVKRLQVVTEGRETFLQARVVTTSFHYMHGRQFPAGIRLTGSTLMGHVMQHPVIVVPPIAAWIMMAPRRRLAALFLLAPALAVAEAIDVPIVLPGSLHDIVRANLAPDAPPDWQETAMRALDGGGRQALCLALAAAVIAASYRIHRAPALK